MPKAVRDRSAATRIDMDQRSVTHPETRLLVAAAVAAQNQGGAGGTRPISALWPSRACQEALAAFPAQPRQNFSGAPTGSS